MKTKAEFIKEHLNLPERLSQFGINVEDVQKIEFKDGKEIIHGIDWILIDQVMLKKPDISDPEVKEHVHRKMKEISSIAKKKLGKE